MYLGQVRRSTDKIIKERVKDIISGLTFKELDFWKYKYRKNTKLRLKYIKKDCNSAPNNTFINAIIRTGIV